MVIGRWLSRNTPKEPSPSGVGVPIGPIQDDLGLPTRVYVGLIGSLPLLSLGFFGV